MFNDNYSQVQPDHPALQGVLHMGGTAMKGWGIVKEVASIGMGAAAGLVGGGGLAGGALGAAAGGVMGLGGAGKTYGTGWLMQKAAPMVGGGHQQDTRPQLENVSTAPESLDQALATSGPASREQGVAVGD